MRNNNNFNSNHSTSKCQKPTNTSPRISNSMLVAKEKVSLKTSNTITLNSSNSSSKSELDKLIIRFLTKIHINRQLNKLRIMERETIKEGSSIIKIDFPPMIIAKE